MSKRQKSLNVDPTVSAWYKAIGAKGGAAGTPLQNEARARNAKLGGWPKGRPRGPRREKPCTNTEK
jgi:hypothetical protein